MFLLKDTIVDRQPGDGLFHRPHKEGYSKADGKKYAHTHGQGSFLLQLKTLRTPKLALDNCF